MKKISIQGQALLSALGVFAYVLLVACFMTKAEAWVGPGPDNIWAPALFLMLFVLSAAVVGLLIFGRPVYLFLSGAKKEAVHLVIYTVAMLFAITMLSFIVFALVSNSRY